MIVNLHRQMTNNVGDLMCAPRLYFPDIVSDGMEIMGFKEGDIGGATKLQWREKFAEVDHFVVGGGGLLEAEFFEPALNWLFENKKPSAKVALWGAGHNNWRVSDWRTIKQALTINRFPFDLVGVRDFDQGFDWVPCVSCMNPAFDSVPAPSEEIVVYTHTGTMKNPNFAARLPHGLPTLANDASFEDAITFLARGDLVLTDSFHGAFWATLMGRRVVAFPSSSKFYSLKHPVPLCDPDDWRRWAPLARRYPMALVECRAANTSFAERVATLFADA